MKLRTFLLLSAVACSFLASDPQAQSNDSTNKLARDIYKQLIEINTTDSVGSTTVAAEAMAQRLRAARRHPGRGKTVSGFRCESDKPGRAQLTTR